MKILNFIWAVGLVIGLFSCESEKFQNDLQFRLEFSDGSQIIGGDILFYDTATHIFFLKNAIDFDQTITGFSVLVNKDTIYKGTNHSCVLSSPPVSTFYISDCFFYGKDILDIGFYPYSKDLRNDPRIISALKNENLIRNGLSCTIDSLNIKSLDNSSEVYCKITITNNDKSGYYIIDPGKMGELDFNYYTGGLSFQNTETGTNSFLRWSEPNADWTEITLRDFTLLPGNSKVSYSFTSSDYYKMDKGFYNARFTFCGLKNYPAAPGLIQKNGRIWLGTAMATKDSVLIE